jgi:RecA-family ATPase
MYEVVEGGFKLRVAPTGLPIHVHRERVLSLLDNTALRWLETYIRTVRPSLVYIDPLYTLGSTDDYFAKTAKRIAVLKAMRDKYGVSFLLVHHTKKAGKDDEGNADREQIWGSQFLNAALETGIQVRRVPDHEGMISVRRHHKSSEDEAALVLSFDIQTREYPNYYHVDIETGIDLTQRKEERKSGKKAQNAEDAILDHLAEHGSATAADLTQTLSYSRSTVNRNLKRMVQQGALDKDGDAYSVVAGGLIL